MEIGLSTLVLVSSTKIKLRKNPIQKLLLIPTLVTLGDKKVIILLLNCKVEKPNDSHLPTCLRVP